MTTGLKANSDGSAAIQVGGTDVITLTSGGAATFVTSPTTVQAGTAAAPSITFSGDTNTGIYSPGADTIAFTEGGVESMRITSAGEVLVGGTTAISADSGCLSIQRAGVATLNLFRNDTTVSPTNVLGSIAFYGNDTTANSVTNLAYIQAVASGDHAAGDNPTDLVFATTPDGSATVAEAGRITQSGAYVLKGGDTTANGTGITFPATQSASSNANTLDDYEEGTFTPTITYVTPGTLSVGYQTQVGRYTKVGRIVFIEITIRLNAFTKGTASGDLLIANLPFAFPASEPLSLFNIGFFNSSFNQFPVAIAFSGAAQMYLFASANNTGWASQPDPDSNAQYFLSGSYTVA